MKWLGEAPDPGWLPILKMIFGLMALAMLCVLAGVIAILHVEEKTSYGLENIVTILGVLSGGFAQWAFSSATDGIKNSAAEELTQGAEQRTSSYASAETARGGERPQP